MSISPHDKSDAHANQKSEASHIPYNWGKIVSGTFHAILHLPNGLWFLLACLAAPALAYMNGPKTVVVCIAAIVLIADFVFVKIAFGQIDANKPPPADPPSQSTSSPPPSAPTPNMNNESNVSQQGNGNVNAPGNQGNINTGPVSGNLNQSIITTPPVRILTEPEEKKLNNLLTASPKCTIYFAFENSATDGKQLGDNLKRIFHANGYSIWPVDAPFSMTPPLPNVLIKPTTEDEMNASSRMREILSEVGIKLTPEDFEYELYQGRMPWNDSKVPGLIIFIGRNDQ